MQPYSENIYFFDTEFTDLDIRRGELLSIGMINYSGEKELYLEFDYESPVHPWVSKNVLPYLNQKKTSVKRAKELISAFMGTDKPYLMAYVNQFDAMYWYRLFGDPKAHPAFWIPIDFASILFAHGFDPNSMGSEPFLKTLSINKNDFKAHNALDDARILRLSYLGFIRSHTGTQ